MGHRQWNPGNVDMDLFLWYEFPAGSGEYEFIDGAFSIGTTFEQLFLPSNSLSSHPNGVYGLGYNYYEGTSNNLAIRANFRSFGGNIGGTSNRTSYTATYTLANINAWDETEDFHVVQYFEKSGSNFINFTPITVPSSGSRSKDIQAAFKELQKSRTCDH